MMPKKRSSPDGSDSDDDSSAEEETGMKIDENNDQDDEEMSDSPTEPVPFLDTFYGLSSLSGSDRAQAAHDLLKHCLFGPNANTKDAAYALKRLLNGLCSGRASARQGYASALTSFLKISFQQGTIMDIMQEDSEDDNEEQAPLVFIRNRLLATTDPNKTQTGKFGKKKGSEERDYCFGRIFGILSVVRSGILLTNTSDESGLEQVAVGYANDLVELYQHKKWMREPATQGILTLLSCFYRSDNEKTMPVANNIVENVITPKLLLLGGEDPERQTLLSQYSPEQIAIAVHIQSNAKGVALAFPLDEPILSSENMEYLSEAFASTSHVVHPRTHLVWDVLWSSLTEPTTNTSRKQSQRVLCQHAPASSESARDVISALFDTVVIKCLLGMHDGEQDSGKSFNATHERRALSLSVVKVLCGGEYMSSTMGSVTILLDPDFLENNIMCPVVVQRLFLDVIAAGSKSGSQQHSQQHMLKPLALHVLESIVPSTEDELSRKRRLSFAKALVRCDSRFDSRTKTRTVSNLLLLDETTVVDEDEKGDTSLYAMWTDYVVFLQQCILEIASKETEESGKKGGPTSTSSEAIGYVDLLYNTVKHILRMQSESNTKSIEEFKRKTTRSALGFLMASAFFDCSELSAPTMTEQKSSGKKKKKTKKKSKGNRSESEDMYMHPAVTAGYSVQNILSSDTDEKDKPTTFVPYIVRATLSSRFYSLLADSISAVVPRRTSKAEKTSTGSEVASKTKGKDERSLEILVDMCHGWTCLESSGAIRFTSTTEEEDEEDTEKTADITKQLVSELQSRAMTWTDNALNMDETKAQTKGKCVFGSAQLMSILYLLLLSCGKPENIADEDDSPDSDDDDSSEVLELISDLSDITKDLVDEKVEDEGERVNPLLGLAEYCVNILSSPLCSGSQTRGAASKIVRETVKSAWTGGLSAATLVDTTPALLDEDVMNTLLYAVGASDNVDINEKERDASDDGMEVDDDSDDEKMSGGGDEVIFSTTAAEVLKIDDDDSDANMANAEADEKDAEDSEEDDVELDPTQLQSLLLEDSDADLSVGSDGELEHHAGADAALAQLIKLKQETRKAGKQAKERLEISNRLRCVVLIECLVSVIYSPSAGSGSNALVKSEVILQTLVHLLQARRLLEKTLASSSDLGKKGTGAINEKKALLDRLTTLLKTKICKMRLASNAAVDSDGVAPYASELMSRILTEARKSNELGHSSCCSAAMIMTLRAIPKSDDKIAAAAVYKDGVKEWSSKRTTRLNTVLFEDLIQQNASLAQTVLASPLATATSEARSPFLKSETFSLLASMYGTAKPPTTDLDSMEMSGNKALKEVAPVVTKNASETLQDSDMQKPKRVRDVLKAMEKVVSFVTMTSMSGEEGNELGHCLQNLLEHLDSLREKSESHGVKNACQKLSSDVAAALEKIGNTEKTDDKVGGDKKAQKRSEKTSSKKKKKKKGKKK